MGMVISPEYIWYDEMKKFIELAFFYYLSVCSLCEFIQGYIICMLHRQYCLSQHELVFGQEEVLCISVLASCDVNCVMDDEDK